MTEAEREEAENNKNVEEIIMKQFFQQRSKEFKELAIILER